MQSLQILPLSKQLTNLAGNSWNSSLQNKRADRNEMLLCHEFHKKKFILPDKETAFSRARKKAATGGGGLDDPFENDQAAPTGPRRGKAMYSGGLVLEPQVGLYDDFVMMLDFNSLYPSVIQEYNICFTTVERPNEDQVAKFNSEAELLAATDAPDSSAGEGVLPLVLRRLVESRRQVKSEIKSTKDPRRLQRLDIRQKALKLTANSMYGCLGFQFSRFHARPLAALVTLRGREALESTIAIVKHELVLDVVYGDTDSVFVNSKTKDFGQAMQVAEQIKRSVNKKYKKLEIEIDGVFGKLLLLKKKKYAGLKVVEKNGKREYEPEIKGLDIVRRDWCSLAKKLGEDILNTVLSVDNEEPDVILDKVHQKLTDAGKAMDENKVPIQSFAITKALTKAPQDYPDAKHQPHVQVALRLMSRGKAVRSGQDIEYIICDVECEGTSFAGRARHPQEFELDPTLKVDLAWYKSQQVHPLISRLLGPIEGTDPARQAECLGMDGTRFARAAAAAGGVANHSFTEAAVDVTELLDRKLKWKKFESSLEGIKLESGEVTSWRQLLKPENWDTSGVGVLFRSPTGAAISPKMAQNVFVMQLRKITREHSEGWVNLGDSEHHVAGLERTRRMRTGQNAISERQVLEELEFLEYLCESAGKGALGEDDKRGCRTAAAGMQRECRWLLECNGYNWVNCGKIFGSLGC